MSIFYLFIHLFVFLLVFNRLLSMVGTWYKVIYCKCRVDTIVITEQPVVLYKAFTKKYGVTRGIVNVDTQCTGSLH
jgi:hypothetical protein